MKKIRTSYKGRICRYPGCRVVLSIYNHEDFCHIHKIKLVEADRYKEVSR